MSTISASYSPEDNKLRLYPTSRLDAETYKRVKEAGYSWAAKQDCFVAPMWTPAREDLALELAGEIDDEDTSLVERAEARAERFEDYRDKRGQEADQARASVQHIMDGIPLGQPLLVGHSSYRHARKDKERIENGMRKAVHLWQTSEYWSQRAAGAIRHAKYKERPDVRARRIKGLEADLRKQEKHKKETETHMRAWGKVTGEDAEQDKKLARAIATYDHIRLPDGHAWGWSIWSALEKGTCTPIEARDYSLRVHEAYLPHCQRWIDHLHNRLTYERAILAESGGTIADQTKPEKGGAVRCWVSRYNGEWLHIKKVNKVSVTVEDNWNNGGKNFTRVIPFDDLKGVMTKAQVDAKREAGLLCDNATGTGFAVLDAPSPPPRPEPTRAPQAESFMAMQAQLKAGITVQVVDQLFASPVALADRVVALAHIQPGERVLEPEAGTGRLVEAVLRVPLFASAMTSEVLAVEDNYALARQLTERRLPHVTVYEHDFLQVDPAKYGLFDVVVMNPPFAKAQEAAHVTHALRWLKPGGRLVAVLSNAITFRTDKAYSDLRQLLARAGVGSVTPLPDDTFKEAGTSVKTVLLQLTTHAEPAA